MVRAGQFAAYNGGINIFQRAFTFWDGERDARKINIFWQDGYITNITSPEGRLDAVRVEPRLFGSVSPLNHEDRTLITLEETPQELIDAMEVQDIALHAHSYSISVETYENTVGLRENMKITQTDVWTRPSDG